MILRFSIAFLLLISVSSAQTSAQHPAPAETPKLINTTPAPNQVVIPAGTQVPLALKQAISTKNAKEGDPVYAETTFPVVINDHIVVPAGTYVQGKISHVQRAGRVKGRAEILMHFTTLIYPSGYTVLLPGALENVPGADKTSMKDKEGTVQQDGQTGEKLGKAADTAAKTGTVGALAGLTAGAHGAAVGGISGAALGAAIAMLSRGADVKLEPGTTVQMEIQRDVPLDPSRIIVAGR